MTLRQAAIARIPRVRHTTWGPRTYYRLPLLPGGMLGPLAELYGETRSVISLATSGHYDGFEPYTGLISWDESSSLLARTFTEF